MKTLAHKTVLALLAGLTFVSLVVPAAEASTPHALLFAPDPGYGLPKFGFESFTIQGVGERVTFVQWDGRAAALGVEAGDIIVSMNGFPLTYHGAWNDALIQALSNGGVVQLAVRDVRTGLVGYRQTFVGEGNGPTSYYVQQGQYNTPSSGNGYPAGPVTYTSQVNPNQNNSNGNPTTVQQMVDVFKPQKP